MRGLVCMYSGYMSYSYRFIGDNFPNGTLIWLMHCSKLQCLYRFTQCCSISFIGIHFPNIIPICRSFYATWKKSLQCSAGWHAKCWIIPPLMIIEVQSASSGLWLFVILITYTFSELCVCVCVFSELHKLLFNSKNGPKYISMVAEV